MFKIVVIDSGVDSNSDFLKDIKYETIEIIKNGSRYEIGKNAHDNMGHGTQVIELLSNLIPNDYFIIMKIFENNEIEEEKLLFALEYVRDNIKCDVISLSIGLNSFRKKEKLKLICNSLVSKGVLIVAAFNNLGGYTYPAVLENVIGVDFDEENRNALDYTFLKDSPINLKIAACKFMFHKKYNDSNVANGSSFCVPYAVKQILDIKSTGITEFNEVISELEKRSSAIIKFPYYLEENNSFNISKAVVFPYNKEIVTLLHYEDMLRFEIQDIFDVKYIGNVGEKNRKNVIKDIEKIDWDKDFDTFILGHSSKLCDAVKFDVTRKIIEKCIINGKNMYCFDKNYIDDEVIRKFNEKNLSIYWPEVSEKNIPFNSMGKLFVSAIPIIGVFGTGSQQGKFSLQIQLKKYLMKRGLKVRQIGTEPAAKLFGFDKVFPVGYNSHNNLTRERAILTLNSMLKDVEEMGADIITLGSQSYTIPYEFSQINYFPLYQQELLYAIRPDLTVLCVSVIDTVEYIKRTIDYIESIAISKVIALVVSPITVTANWGRIGNKKNYVTDKNMQSFIDNIQVLDLPIFKLKSERDIDKLVQVIINDLSN